MYPWRRILIPTDFSTASEWAFDDAIQLAAATNAELLILHIRITQTDKPSELRFPLGDAAYEYAERQELEALRERVRRINAKVQTRLIVKKSPDPGSEICTSAKSENADLVVVATHARHHVAHLLIGSTTMKVISEPPAPILAIRYGIPKRGKWRRIVVPVHLKQTGETAAELAAEVARDFKCEVHLLCVCESRDRAAAEEHVDSVGKRLFENVFVKRAVIDASDVEKEVLRY
ncbi:MAG TPA: universal stress protein, partial [Thermoanaerobaculia bacterium]|nr:universal stress protein [Thermoanaerobaculia bacterium]